MFRSRVLCSVAMTLGAAIVVVACLPVTSNRSKPTPPCEHPSLSVQNDTRGRALIWQMQDETHPTLIGSVEALSKKTIEVEGKPGRYYATPETSGTYKTRGAVRITPFCPVQ